MIQIVQLSDLHVADWSGFRLADIFNKRLTGWANHRLTRSDKHQLLPVQEAVEIITQERPDAVVVSGDLTNTASHAELEAANKVLQPLLDAGVTTAVIPGNHDLYVADTLDGRLDQAWRRYAQHDPDASVTGARLLRVGGVSVILINSALPAPAFVAWGKISQEALAQADALVQAERAAGQAIAVAVHHHPTPFPGRRFDGRRGIRNGAEFRELLAKWRPELVFHGHNHHHELRRLGSADGPVVVGTGSASLAADPRPGRQGEFARFSFEAGRLTKLEFRRWLPREQRWTEWREEPLESVVRVAPL